MKYAQGFLLVGCAFLLGACSLKNQENNYMRQSVVQSKALVTPAPFVAPKTSPVLALSAGQNSYPAVKSSSTLLPPGYHKNYPLPAKPKAKK